MIERAVCMILKGIAFTLVIGASIAVIIWACCSCGRKTADPPLQYQDRMKLVDKQFNGRVRILVDKETGVCYLWDHAVYGEGGFTVMVDHDGRPFIANGWRDYSDSDS